MSIKFVNLFEIACIYLQLSVKSMEIMMNLTNTHGPVFCPALDAKQTPTYRSLLTHSHFILHLKDFEKYLGTVSRGFQLKACEFGTQWNKAKHPAVAFHHTAYIIEKANSAFMRKCIVVNPWQHRITSRRAHRRNLPPGVEIITCMYPFSSNISRTSISIIIV